MPASAPSIAAEIAHLHVALDAEHLDHGDEALVIIAQRSDLGREPGKKMALNH